MFNRFRKKKQTETRTERRSYSSAVLAGLVAEAEGSIITSAQTLAAVETAAGLWSRAFASAKLEPHDDKLNNLTPELLAHIGRQLIKRGECLLRFDVIGGEVMFEVASQWDVRGNADWGAYYYDITLQRPSGATRYMTTGVSVLHFKYAYTSERPWCGISPLTGAAASVRLARELERQLGDEASSPSAYLLPIPADGGDGDDDDALNKLKTDIANAKGKPLLLETTSGGWGEGRAAAPNKDWEAKRLGANIPDALVDLRMQAEQSVLASCGIPPALANAQGQGTTLREAWRQFLHASVSPVANLISAELREKLEIDDDLHFNFDKLMASDITGRARAFQSLVKGGMDVDKAAAVSGVMTDD